MVDQNIPVLGPRPKAIVVIVNKLPPIYKSALHLYREATPHFDMDETIDFKVETKEASYVIEVAWLCSKVVQELKIVLLIEKKELIRTKQGAETLKFTHGIEIQSPMEKQMLTLI